VFYELKRFAASNGAAAPGMTCQDYVNLKQQGSAACQKAGRTLVGLQSHRVGCPDGQWNTAAYKCCASGPAPDPCTYSKVGDGVTCQDEIALTQQAADIGTAAGLSMTGAKLPHDCPGGQSTWSGFACCPAKP